MLRALFNDGWMIAPEQFLFAAALVPVAPVDLATPSSMFIPRTPEFEVDA